MGITIAGLGPGSVEDLTRRSWRALTTAPRLYLRTAHHGCVAAFPPSLHYESFDALYETHDRFEVVYRAIILVVMAAAREGDVVYAVPGDPLLGEVLVINHREAEITPRQRVMLDFAWKATVSPKETGAEDRVRLRDAGFSERDIWDIANVTGFFNFSNRVAMATGMTPNPDSHDMAREPAEDGK